jgi:hypothetical protein
MTFKTFLLEAEEQKKPTFCYMLYCTDGSNQVVEELQKQISNQVLAGELESPDNFHCTIRYVKMNQGQSPDKFVEWFSGLPLPIIEGFTSKFSIFKDGCIVTELESPGMHEWFGKINAWMTTEGGYPPSDFPTYKPHVTLYKGSENINPPEFRIGTDNKKLFFNRHIITNKDREVIFEKIV